MRWRRWTRLTDAGARVCGRGAEVVDGVLRGDLVEDAAPGYGWSWDDLPYGTVDHERPRPDGT